MTIEIYRKKLVFNSFVVEDNPIITWENVEQIEIFSNGIKGDLNGEELTIDFDHLNYHYLVK